MAWPSASTNTIFKWRTTCISWRCTKPIGPFRTCYTDKCAISTCPIATQDQDIVLSYRTIPPSYQSSPPHPFWPPSILTGLESWVPDALRPKRHRPDNAVQNVYLRYPCRASIRSPKVSDTFILHSFMRIWRPSSPPSSRGIWKVVAWPSFETNIRVTQVLKHCSTTGCGAVLAFHCVEILGEASWHGGIEAIPGQHKTNKGQVRQHWQ